MRLYMPGGLFVLRGGEMFGMGGWGDVMPMLSCRPLEIFKKWRRFFHVYEVEPGSHVAKLVLASEEIESKDYWPFPPEDLPDKPRSLQIKAPKKVNLPEEHFLQVQERIRTHLKHCCKSENCIHREVDTCVWKISMEGMSKNL